MCTQLAYAKNKHAYDQGPQQKCAWGKEWKGKHPAKEEKEEGVALSKELVMEVVHQYDHNRTCLSTMMAEVNRKLTNKKISDTDKKTMKEWMLEAVAAREERNQEGIFEMKEPPCGQKRKMHDMENTIVATHRVHTINPDKPVLCAAAPSDKKTSLCETTRSSRVQQCLYTQKQAVHVFTR